MAHTKVIVLRPVQALNPIRIRLDIVGTNMTAVARQMLERDA